MLKVQCSCGHKIAVPDSYDGKRIKCPKCQGPVFVTSSPAPMGKAAPVVEAAALPDVTDLRYARARRKAMESKRKSHNMTVAIIAGSMVLIALVVMLLVGINKLPDPVAPVDPEEAPRKSAQRDNPSGLRTIGGSKSSGNGDMYDEGSSSNHTATSGDNATAVASTTTYDADGDVTTIKSQPSRLTVGNKAMIMTITLTHNGQDIRSAVQLSAQMRVKGNFDGLVSGANTDEPRLILDIDGREEQLVPSGRDESDERKEENGPEILPGWVEYTFSRHEIIGLARSSTLRSAFGSVEFSFTPEQLALFRSFAPAPPRPAAPAPREEKADEGNAPAEPKDPDGADPATGDADDKEMMDKEMKKKK